MRKETNSVVWAELKELAPIENNWLEAWENAFRGKSATEHKPFVFTIPANDTLPTNPRYLLFANGELLRRWALMNERYQLVFLKRVRGILEELGASQINVILPWGSTTSKRLEISCYTNVGPQGTLMFTM